MSDIMLIGWQKSIPYFFITIHQNNSIHIIGFSYLTKGIKHRRMMERDDIIICHFFIFFVEGLDEVNIFGDRGDDDDIRSDKFFFIKSFAEKFRIEL